MLNAVCRGCLDGGLGQGVGNRCWPPVPQLWYGERAVIIAGGPSLTQAQVTYTKEAQITQEVRVIAINNAFTIAPWADLLYACDGNWWRHHPDALEFEGMKVTQDATVQGTLRIPSVNEKGLSLDPLRINQGANSGYQAINLAVLLGAFEIILLGFDMKAKGSHRHWHADHPSGLNNPSDSNFESWIKNFDEMLPDLDRAGVRVINCSPGSALEAFPIANLEDVL